MATSEVVSNSATCPVCGKVGVLLRIRDEGQETQGCPDCIAGLTSAVAAPEDSNLILARAVQDLTMEIRLLRQFVLTAVGIVPAPTGDTDGPAGPI